MSNKKTIMYNSDDAAVYESRTLTGWWTPKDTRTGKPVFWGDDEHMARYCGSTHNTCECGGKHSKTYTCCKECRSKKEAERYRKLLIKQWDGETPLCIYNDDTYFFDTEDIRDYCEENGVDSESLMLVICEPVFPSPVSPYDQWADDLPEDGEIPDNILAAVEALNDILQTSAPLCWRQGDCRTVVRLDA